MFVSFVNGAIHNLKVNFIFLFLDLTQKNLIENSSKNTKT